MNPDPEILASLRKLYPDLTDEELVLADDNLTRYVALVLRIFERINPQDEDLPPLTQTNGTLQSKGTPSASAK